MRNLWRRFCHRRDQHRAQERAQLGVYFYRSVGQCEDMLDAMTLEPVAYRANNMLQLLVL